MPLTIQERFEAFHEANPHVYKLFRRFARQARKAGLERYSADAILHRIRWHLDIEVVQTDDPDHQPFKINDHYSSRYARMMVTKNPSFQGFFALRELKRT